MWYAALIRRLEEQTENHAAEDDIDCGVCHYPKDYLTLHLFGIARPFFALRSPLIKSVDSSGPAQQARFGWKNIAPTFEPTYGISDAKLQQSRAARLAYWIIRYRDQLNLSWQFIDADRLPNDRVKPPHIQHGLFDIPIV